MVVAATVRLVLHDRLLRLLLAVSLLVGPGLASLELLAPLHFAELAGSPELGSAVFGIVTAVSFAAAAVGSLLAPAAGRAAGGSMVVVSAVTSVLAAVAYAAFYLLNATAWPSRKQLMHDQTTSAQRSTTVSASSLALMVGGLLGNLLLPRLADSAGVRPGEARRPERLLGSGAAG